MIQTEIQFFYPLTEQIPLDLDYTNCAKPQLYYPLLPGGGGATLYNSNMNGAITTLTASNMTIDVSTTTFKVTEEPPLYRKFLYRLMNIKWEKK